MPTAGEKPYDTLLGLWSWMTFLSATDLRCWCKVNVDPNRLGSDLPMPPDGAMQNTEPATPCTKSPGEERPRRMEGWKRWGEGGVKAAWVQDKTTLELVTHSERAMTIIMDNMVARWRHGHKAGGNQKEMNHAGKKKKVLIRRWMLTWMPIHCCVSSSQ